MTGVREDDPRDLVLKRLIDAPPMAVFRCWTEPALIVQWFTPPPWKTIHAEVDLRPGGGNVVTMQGPNGEEMPHTGVYLEVEPGRRLVVTDAYTAGWLPSARPFMTAILTFEDAGDGRTAYTARCRHWTMEAKAEHEAMGFHEGWGVATDQLAALARTL